MITFRPTLVIGLGGSGSFVVRRLKKRFRRLVQADLPPSVQLLAFDTDAQKPLELLEELTKAEFFRLSNFNGGNFTSRAALAANPAIAVWWKFQRLTPGFVQDGANQRPPVGRLAFFVKFTTVHNQIEAAIQRMFQPVGEYIPPQNINAVDVYIVGSSCGGTGAGMFFDMAVLSRYLVTRTAREAILQGHAFLPSCFEGTPTPQVSLQTNALAFLRTMEGMQAITVPEVTYPGFQTQEMAAPLFSRVHLISGVDVTGVRAVDLQGVFEKVALQLDLEISSAAGRDMQSAIDNCRPDFNNRPGGRLATYSSYGAALLSGASDFGRLALLPAFCSQVVRALASDPPPDAPVSDPTPDRAVSDTAIRNSAFRRTLDILESDVAALELVPDFGAERNRLLGSEDPGDAVRSLVRRVDTVASTLSLSWLSTLGGVSDEIGKEAARLIEAGPAGIPHAMAYLQMVQAEVGKLNERVEACRSAPTESADQIVAKVRGFFVSKAEKQRILETQGYPFLKQQTLARVREALARKVQADVAGWSREVAAKLAALQKFFPAGVKPFVESVEHYSREALAKQRAIMGPAANVADFGAISARFEGEAAKTADRFLGSPEGRRALRVLSQSMLKEEGSDTWGSTLLEAADEFLSKNLADSVTLTPEWPQKSAQEIISCRPMVQFVADHLNTGPNPATFAYARAYDKDRVHKALQMRDPGLNVSIESSSEPGTLEVCAMALNFALSQIQETRLIDAGYKQFVETQLEPTENRYAWRGPGKFYDRIKQLSLFPLSRSEQALARVLALYPPPPASAIASLTVGGYLINGEPLEVDSEASQLSKYQAFNRRLVSEGYAERLLQQWKMLSDIEKVREHLKSVGAKIDEEIRRANARVEEAGGPEFVSLLQEEREAAAEEHRRI
jgi:hypothetical protein